jgi:hypothetical protein
MVLPNGTGPKVQFKIQGILFQCRGLIGRTMVYHVTRMHDNGEEEHNQALKMGWPVDTRPCEASIIEQLRAAVPAWKDYLPKVIFSTSMTAVELDLPRVELLKDLSYDDLFGYKDRDLHILALRKYLQSWAVNSIDEFKDVLVDSVECE